MTNSLTSCFLFCFVFFISEILAMLTDSYLTFGDIFMCKYKTNFKDSLCFY